MLPFLVESFRRLRPELGNALSTVLAGLHNNEEKADAFRSEFLRSRIPTGEFAQELAGILDDSLEIQRNATGPFSWIFTQTEAEKLSADVVPQYIRDALKFLDVINVKNPNDSDGAT